MAKINILDSSVYNQIAAGEVVERPASVIKELVENSIDSGASIITIEIENGGIDLMSVTDNGSGIEKEELHKAFLPHATSKISSESDLVNILTLGFRGEALASIAAVSSVTITSKPKEQECAYLISATAGNIGKIEPSGADNGTTVKVQNLFYNVPARAKFLKKPKQEEGEITNIVSRFILANPNISIRYIADGKTIYQSAGQGVKDALFCVYGKDGINQTLPVSYSCEGLKISGVIGKPSINKPNRTYQTIIINGRFINSQQISYAVTNAYLGFLMKRQYPFFVLYLEIDPDLVDVNVHPNKMEVRFQNGEMIFDAIYKATLEALSKLDSISEINLFKEKEKSTEQISQEKAQELVEKSFGFNKVDDVVVTDDEVDYSSEEKQEKIDDKREQYLSSMIHMSELSTQGVADGLGIGSILLDKLAKFDKPEKQKLTQDSFDVGTVLTRVGKVFNTYLILQDADTLYFIDQHAAHERLLYEKFKEAVEKGELAVQPLIAPYIFSVNNKEREMLLGHMENLTKLGFFITEFGDNAYKVEQIPAILVDINFADFFNEFLQENKRTSNITSTDLIRDELMQMACKSAVKGGDNLTSDEISKLYVSLGKGKVALFCPHGRPIVIRINKDEIDKWFKRIV